MTDLLSRLRLLLQDENGEIWNDGELTDFINEGQDEYAEKTACLCNDFQLITESGSGEFPDDFVGYKHGVNVDGATIYPSTWIKLQGIYGEEFIDTEDTPEYIYDDLSSDGSYRVCPVPDQAVSSESGDSAWGLALIDGCTDIWGRIESDDYELNGLWGVTESIREFTEAGTVYYSRRPLSGTIEIQDRLALVYYAAAKAFELETERKSVKMATALRGLFRNRVNKFSRAAASKIQYNNNNVGSWF